MTRSTPVPDAEVGEHARMDMTWHSVYALGVAAQAWAGGEGALENLRAAETPALLYQVCSVGRCPACPPKPS